MWPLLLALAVAQPEPEEATIPPALAPALKILRPHLEWHAPAAPPRDEDRIRAIRDVMKRQETSGPWQPAMGAPKDWQTDIPKELIAAVERRARDLPARPTPPPLSAYAWRLKDPAHADVARALKMLEAVGNPTAERWAAEIRRNNTVLTLDVGGAFAVEKKARVVLDARNADRATVRLYRMTTAEDLLRTLDRIGTDFIFRRHDFDERKARAKRGEDALEKIKEGAPKAPPPLPDVLKEKPLAVWQLNLDTLRRIDPYELRYPDDLDNEWEDDRGYNDRCVQFRERLHRDYLQDDAGRFSTWRAGLIVEIPAEHLRQPGAYLMQVEANGQFALAPVLVDPPALTLRRCPDGVLAVVSDPSGEKPLAGAILHARKHVEPATTDAAGVAFHRVVGQGDRAIVAEHQGRFAVGGFGLVFTGIYHDPTRDQRARQLREIRKQLDRARNEDALVYANGLVIGLWTDRPVYRPGETVQAKLIVRQRVQVAGGAGFRAGEFDAPKLELLPVNTEVALELHGPGEVPSIDAKWKLNDFGTAIGTFRIPDKAEPGEISLRVTIDKRTCLVPEVFAVNTRPRILAEIDLAGLPEKTGAGQKLPLTFVGRYPGGLPIAGGTVTLHLANETTRWNLTPDPVELDRTGRATSAITLPLALPAEAMTLRATLTDPTGQRTTRAFPLKIEAGASPLLGGLASVLPADPFVSWGCDTDEIELEQGRIEDGRMQFRTTRVAVVNKRAHFKFPSPGWWMVRAGREEKEVFVHGGKLPPWATCTRRQHENDEDVTPWVDLAHYGAQEGTGEDDDSRPPLLALFPGVDRAVGQTLSIVVYVPFDSARILITLEGHSVIDYWITSVDGQQSCYHVLQVPLRERHRPHVYIQGTFLGTRGAVADEEQKERARQAREELEAEYGEDPQWCKIRVRGAGRPAGVRVELTTDKPEYEPGETGTVTLRTFDEKGQPVVTELALAAIDERVFAGENDRLPNLLAAFTGSRGPERFQRKTWRTSVGVLRDDRQAQALQKQLEQAKAAQLAQRSSDEERLQAAHWRSRADLGDLPIAIMPLGPARVPGLDTALAQPRIVTDAEGRATVRFTAPTNLGRYRLTALALTRKGELGLGRATFRSGKPLEVEVHLPAEVIVGIPFEVPVQVRNFSDRPRSVELSLTFQGLQYPGNLAPRMPAIVVPARDAATVRVKFEARKEGSASLTVRADDRAHDDAETRSTRIVKPKPPEEAEKKPEENRQ